MIKEAEAWKKNDFSFSIVYSLSKVECIIKCLNENMFDFIHCVLKK